MFPCCPEVCHDCVDWGFCHDPHHPHYSCTIAKRLGNKTVHLVMIEILPTSLELRWTPKEWMHGFIMWCLVQSIIPDAFQSEGFQSCFTKCPSKYGDTCNQNIDNYNAWVRNMFSNGSGVWDVWWRHAWLPSQTSKQKWMVPGKLGYTQL
jgi:hypothetical protein